MILHSSKDLGCRFIRICEEKVSIDMIERKDAEEGGTGPLN